MPWLVLAAGRGRVGQKGLRRIDCALSTKDLSALSSWSRRWPLLARSGYLGPNAMAHLPVFMPALGFTTMVYQWRTPFQIGQALGTVLPRKAGCRVANCVPYWREIPATDHVNKGILLQTSPYPASCPLGHGEGPQRKIARPAGSVLDAAPPAASPMGTATKPLAFDTASQKIRFSG